jgi:hypothetical protein
MRKWMKHAITTASAFTVLILPLAFPGLASAASQIPAPAPSCVVLFESWRYTDASNDCADTVNVMAVYQDGATGWCYTLAPGAMRTVGEGYLGRHGHADHLALCEPS